MPTSGDLRRSARSSSAASWILEQHVHAVGERRGFDLGGGAVVERRHDDEDAVGARK
jgi:hypothetical protein